MTGAGMEVGGGLVVSDASTRLAVDLRARTLVMHQAEGFRERGMAVSLSYNPTPVDPAGLRGASGAVVGVVYQFEFYRFLYGPRGPGFGARGSIRLPIHSASRQSSASPAACAGVVLSVPWRRQKLCHRK